jgi:enoyl-CoA hydratase/carnithine racemase
VSDRPISVVTHGEAVVELRLARPDRHNAVSTALLQALRDELVALADDRRRKVVVLTGEGPSFCAGADLAEFAAAPPDPADLLARVRLVIRCMQALLDLEQVTIAAVHGAVIGAGWGLSMSCNLCWAAQDVVFSLPEVAKGYRIPRPLVRRLTDLIGPVRAAEVLLSGSSYDIEAALATGVVTRRFADADAVRDEALAFAGLLADKPRAVLAGAVDPMRGLGGGGASPELEYQWPERRL